MFLSKNNEQLQTLELCILQVIFISCYQPEDKANGRHRKLFPGKGSVLEAVGKLLYKWSSKNSASNQ